LAQYNNTLPVVTVTTVVRSLKSLPQCSTVSQIALSIATTPSKSFSSTLLLFYSDHILYELFLMNETYNCFLFDHNTTRATKKLAFSFWGVLWTRRRITRI